MKMKCRSRRELDVTSLKESKCVIRQKPLVLTNDVSKRGQQKIRSPRIQLITSHDRESHVYSDPWNTLLLKWPCGVSNTWFDLNKILSRREVRDNVNPQLVRLSGDQT